MIVQFAMDHESLGLIKFLKMEQNRNFKVFLACDIGSEKSEKIANHRSKWYRKRGKNSNLLCITFENLKFKMFSVRHLNSMKISFFKI